MEVEWQELGEIDIDGMLSAEGYELGDAEVRETLRMGIRCRDAEMVKEFIERIKVKMRWKNVETLLMDYKNCDSTEDYQREIVDTVTAFIKSKYPEKEERIRGSGLNVRATSCLGLLEEKANVLRKNFLFIADFRGIKISHLILRPGEKFWLVYDAMNRCRSANLIWIMDDDPEGIETLLEHGQMNRVFYDGTDLFLLI